MNFQQAIIVITVVLASMLQLIDTSIVNVTLGQMMGNLGATLGDVSWVITAYAVANVVMIALSGWCGNYFGRKRYFAASILVFTLASLGCAMAENVWVLVFFRFVQGLGGGGLLSTSQAILIETFPREKMGLANAIYGMGVVIGPTIGPALGGWITDHLSWPWVFYVNLPLGLVAFLMTLNFIHEPTDAPPRQSMDWLGLILLVVGVSSLQIVLERGAEEDWFDSKWILGLSFAAVIGCIWFVRHSWNNVRAVMNLNLFKDRNFSLGAILNLILGFGLFGSVFIIPVFCQSFLHFSAMQTGMLLVPGSLATAFAMPFIGKMMQRQVPAQPLTAIGFLGFAWFSWVLAGLTSATGQDDFMLPLLVRGVAMGLLFIPLNVISLANLQGRDMAQGTGMTNMVRQLGGSIGVAFMSTFLTQRTEIHTARLSEWLSDARFEVQQRLQILVAGMQSKGIAPWEAKQKAIATLGGQLKMQAALMAYNDAFWLMAVLFVLCLPVVFFFTPPKKASKVKVEMHAE